MSNIDADKMDLMLLVRDQRRAICDVVEATGRNREEWRLDDVADYVRVLRAEYEYVRAELDALKEPTEVPR